MLGDKWAHWLALEGIIPAEDEALYSYGLRQSGVFLLNVVTILALGWCLGMIGESVVFILAYFPIRRMAGGYHAGTQKVCYLLGIVLTLAVLWTVRLLGWRLGLSFVLLAMGSGLIWLLAPVEDRNKPLDGREVVRFRRRARQFLLAELAIYGLLAVSGAKTLAMTLAVSLAALGVMLLLGWGKNYFAGK